MKDRHAARLMVRLGTSRRAAFLQDSSVEHGRPGERAIRYIGSHRTPLGLSVAARLQDRRGLAGTGRGRPSRMGKGMGMGALSRRANQTGSTGGGLERDILSWILSSLERRMLNTVYCIDQVWTVAAAAAE
jgi:hypothetical protein